MSWLTAALVASYIGVCEVRAPNAWQACESRWNWALGVLVPSPVPGAVTMARRFMAGTKRRQDERKQ